MFFAEKNNGAFFNNHRIRVSKKNNIDDCLFALGGELINNINFLNRKSGCAALDLKTCREDMMDTFKKDLNLWDIAAGIIIVNEAGGMIITINLNSLKNINVIASNPNISAKFQEKLHNF